jgi:Heparinase II/III-like protein
VHRRAVELHVAQRTLQITDSVTTSGVHPARLSFHLGPIVQVELDGARAILRWPARSRDGTRTAELSLPRELDWTVHRGQTDPPLGWYSPRFGSRIPTGVLVGRGAVGPDSAPFVTTLSCRS